MNALSNSKVSHVFHVWINSEAGDFSDKPAEMPIDPHGDHLYGWKAALQTLPWLGKQIGKDRRKELPLVHQQCSHSSPEQLPDNHLTCWLGQRLTECPILKRLRDTFDRERQKEYYVGITDDQVDEAAASVCVWHLFSQQFHGVFVDWNEGAVQDVSDRRFWQNVYRNLAGDPPEGHDQE